MSSPETITVKPPVEPAHHVAFSRPLVCVLEDDADLRHALSRGLAGAGYAVIQASDGEQMLARWPWLETDAGVMMAADLIVTDQRLPGCTGLELLAAVRQWDLVTPVILMSAFLDEDITASAYELGVCAVLAKPFSLDLFLEKVGRVAPLS